MATLQLVKDGRKTNILLVGNTVAVRDDLSLSDLDEGQVNILSPVAHAMQMGDESPFHLSIGFVKIDPTPENTFAPDSYKKGLLAFKKRALLLLLEASGARLIDEKCGRVDDGKDDEVCRYRAVGYLTAPTGERMVYTAERQINLRAMKRMLLWQRRNQARKKVTVKRGGNEMKKYPYERDGFDVVEEWVEWAAERDVAQAGNWIEAHAETRALLRLARVMLKIKPTYTRDELKRPFAMPRWTFAPWLAKGSVLKLISDRVDALVAERADLAGQTVKPGNGKLDAEEKARLEAQGRVLEIREETLRDLLDEIAGREAARERRRKLVEEKGAELAAAAKAVAEVAVEDNGDKPKPTPKPRVVEGRPSPSQTAQKHAEQQAEEANRKAREIFEEAVKDREIDPLAAGDMLLAYLVERKLEPHELKAEHYRELLQKLDTIDQDGSKPSRYRNKPPKSQAEVTSTLYVSLRTLDAGRCLDGGRTVEPGKNLDLGADCILRDWPRGHQDPMNHISLAITRKGMDRPFVIVGWRERSGPLWKVNWDRDTSSFVSQAFPLLPAKPPETETEEEEIPF